MTECPKSGVYLDVPFEDYTKWDAVSNSRLSRMAVSPRHYVTPVKYSSPALAFGSLTHTGRLEPLALAERYAVQSDWHLDDANENAKGVKTDSKATSYYKNKLREFTKVNAGKEVVSRDDFNRMAAIVRSIDADQTARSLFNEPGPVEVSMVWDDPETGLRCKGRIDKVCSESSRMADLKTTADLRKFPKSIANFGYHRQAAFYQRGWAVLNGGELLEPWLVPVESTPPHCVQSAPVSAVAIAIGEEELNDLLHKVAECHERGEWPGPDGPDSWELPEWATNTKPLELTIGGTTLKV